MPLSRCFARSIPKEWIVIITGLWTVIAHAQTTRYISPSGSHSPPFTSWATAATNIQLAIDYAIDGDTLWVGTGTYLIATQINLTKSLVLESQSGPELTIIARRPSATARIFNISNANAIVAGFTVSNGMAGGNLQGSGLFISAGTVSNCVITASQGNRGSAVYLTGASSLLTHSRIYNNQDNGNSGGCGGVRILSGAIMRYCTLDQNRPGSENNGVSALYMQGNSTVEFSIISNNFFYSPIQSAIAVAMQAGDTLRNTLIVDNLGRGLHMSGGTVQHVTIARNWTYSGAGHGLFISGGQIQNSIIAKNGRHYFTPWAAEIVQTGGAISNSCGPALSSTGGNHSTDPLFINPDAGDYRLLPGSPARDTATNLTPAVTLDLTGNIRPLDGDGDSLARPDMGAYEMPDATAGALSAGFRVDTAEAVGSLLATFTPFAAGADTAITFAGWSFGDGAISNRTSLTPVSHAYTTGFFTVSLTLSNMSGESVTVTMPNFIRVAGESAFVAPNGGHVPPFDTWSRASTSIQDAVYAVYSVTGEPRVVSVAPGLYAPPAPLDIHIPAEIRSVNGPSSTFINGSGLRGIQITHPKALFAGFTVTNANAGGLDGSGAYVTAGTISNCVFTRCWGNRASTIFLTGSNTLLTHSTISNNTETGNSGGCGGLRMLSGARMEYCLLTRNTPGSESLGVSAVFMQGNSFMSHCIISNNPFRSANTACRAVAMQAGDVVRNCLISDNAGRGLHMTGGLVENATITRNTVYGDDANGLLLTNNAVARNCIVWGNGIDNTKNLRLFGSSTFEFSNVNPAQPGTGNLNTDPLFLNPTNGDFRLDAASPMINAGTNQPWMLGTTDLQGSPRILAGVVDLGAYEAPDPSGGPLTCNFDPSVLEGFTNLAVVFTASLTGSNTNITSWSWTFGDGNSLSSPDAAIVTNVYTFPGLFTVTLQVENDANETASRTKEGLIYIAPPIAYVATNGTHQFPFDSWGKAATNIQDAVNAARRFDEAATLVLVSNGTYSLPAQLNILKGIPVRSANGPAVTLITRTGGRLTWVNHPDAVVDGFTFTNGLNYGNTAGAMSLDAGLVMNCVFIRNRGDRVAGALQMTDGTVSNCLFLRNWDTGNSSGCGGIVMSGGLVTHSIIRENIGGSSLFEVGGIRATGGRIENCVIVSNRYGTAASGTAGGVALSGSASIRNSLIAHNDGRGLVVGSGSAINVTVVRNSLEGLYQSGGGVTNAIIIFNNGGGTDLDGPLTNCAYSCSPALPHNPTGTGNINLDPLFIAPGSGYGTNSVAGNYRPSKNSPCLDAGTALPWMVTATDLDGQPRILNKAPDMGAYETLKPPSGTVLIIR